MKKTLIIAVCLLVANLYGHEPEKDSVFHLNSVHLSQRIHDQKAANPDLKLAPTKLLELRTSSVLNNLTYFNGVSMQKISSQFKPIIRGARNQRVSVLQNEVRIEGQDWGADHGLDLNEANIRQIRMMSHTSTLLFQSDAVNGLLLVEKNARFHQKDFNAQVAFNSVNDGVNAGVFLHRDIGVFHISSGYQHQTTGDLKVPTDDFYYLSTRLPVEDNRLNNTASVSHDFSLSIGLDSNNGDKWDLVSEFNYDKLGFFAAAHGVPTTAAAKQDHDYFDIDLPYQKVIHWMETLHYKGLWNGAILNSTFSFQHNIREEYSRFTTHYPLEGVEPTDLEVSMKLSSFVWQTRWKKDNLQWSFNSSFYRNRTDGYSFFLPEYNKWMNALAGVYSWDLWQTIHLDLGARLEHQWVDISPFYDINVKRYLEHKKRTPNQVEQGATRSVATDKNFLVHSLSAHLKIHPTESQLLGLHIAHTSRIPHAAELSSNGHHHGAFRFEKGNPNLDPERALKTNLHWQWLLPKWSFEASVFGDFYSNYIFLNPSGIWSYLPDAGQEYHYQQSRVVIAGLELESDFHFEDWSTQTKLEWLSQRRYDNNNNLVGYLPFSVPMKLTNSFEWKAMEDSRLHLKLSHDFVFSQNNIAVGELPTQNYQLLNAAIYGTIGSQWEWKIEGNNLFNETYFDHLSYYRIIEVTEPGFNFNLSIQYQI